MANKKLKVELELETAKAKQQLGRVGDGVGSSAPSQSSRSIDKLSEATRLNTNQMLSMTRAFSGMALGLAASYSSSYFAKGSLAEKAMGYGGSILSGASMGAAAGSVAGPWGLAAGTVIGGGTGAAKEYFDRKKAIKDARKDFTRFEESLKGNENFSNFMKRMTSPFNTKPLGLKLAMMSDYYAQLNTAIESLIPMIDRELKKGKLDQAAKHREDLARTRGYRDKLMSVAEAMDNSYGGPSRPSMSATDALMKIGGGFGLQSSGSGGEVAVLLHGIEVQNDLLRDIRANTLKKGSVWL